MKIAYISNSVIPSRTANSIHVMKMCQAFGQIGHDVLLLAPDRGKDREPGITDVFGYYGIQEPFPIRLLPCPDLRGRDWIYSFFVRRELKKFRPGLVYGRYLMGCAHAAGDDHMIRFEIHSPLWRRTRRDYALFRKLTRSENLQRLIAITRALKKMCGDEGLFPQEKIIVAPDGADVPEDLSPLPEWPGRKGALQAGYVGHLYPGRGIDIIIQLAEVMEDVDFHVIGGTQQDIKYWKSRTRAPNVIFHGHVPPGDVHRYRNSCDVLLAPYQDEIAVADGGGDTSGVMSPLKIFEYMASKRPIVASDLPAVREVLDSANAILVRHDSVQEWKAAILKLGDKQDRDRLARRAYEDFTASYTWRRRAEKVLG